MLAVVALVVALIVGPLRAGGSPPEPERSADRDELEAAKEAKYREIRDADLDHRTGKLSDADWHALDTGLRAEAIEILRRLDQLG